MQELRLNLDCDLKLVKIIVCFGPSPISFYSFYDISLEETDVKPKTRSLSLGLRPLAGCCCNKNKAATVRVPEMLPAAVVATTTTQPNGIAWPPIIIGQQQPVIPSGVPVIPLISTTTTTNNVSNPHPPPPITTTRPATQQPTPSAPPAEQLW